MIAVTFVGCGLALITALLSLRLHAEGYDARAVGINTAAGGVATLVGAPFIPEVARRLGVARLLLVSLVIGVAAILGFTVTHGFAAWFVLRFFVGLSATVTFVLSEFWIATWAPPSHRNLIIGLYVTSLAAGFAIGPALLVATGTDGILPFGAGAALLLAATVPLAVTGGAAPCIEGTGRRTLLDVLRQSPAATLAAGLHGAIEIAGMGLLPVYALRSGLDARWAALLSSIFIVGSSTLQLPVGALADRLDRGRLLVGLAAAGLAGAAVLAAVGASDVAFFSVLLFIWAGFVGALYPVGLGEISAQFSGPDLASANSAYVMSYAVGMLAGPPLIGVGLDLIPPSGFFWTIAVLAGLYLAVVGARVVRLQVKQA